LLPQKSFPNEVYTSRLDVFIQLKRRWRVSIQAMIYRCNDLGLFDADQVLNLRKQISFRKWRTKEPLDDPRIIPLEQPRLLRRAVELVLEGGRRHPDEILADLPLRPALVESFYNLPEGALSRGSPQPFEPTLK
jgi:Zn-dependent peptidase ImmA (M78 family)